MKVKQAEPVVAELAGKERLFCFNAWAQAEVEDEFDGLAKWGDIVNSGRAADKVSAIAKMGEILMEAGRRWSNYRDEPPHEVMTEDAITALLGLAGMGELLKIEYETIVAGQRRTVGAEPPKNADTTPVDM